MSEMNEVRRHGGDATIAFTVGLAVGAVTALLLAPAPGQETRRRLGDFTKRVGARVKDGVENARTHASDMKNRLGSAIEEGTKAYHSSDPRSETRG
jgi:gas vesicle protein